MKRMYVTLGLIFSVLIWAVTGLGQKITHDSSDNFQKRMQLREEMHKRLRDKLIHGIGPDTDLFKDMDLMFEDVMPSQSHVETEWQESKEGRTLVVKLKDKDQRLDINVENGLVTIKGKNEVKSANGTSVFSNSFSIPVDCDPSKVKMDQKNDQILVSFPYKGGEVKSISPPLKKDKRVPLPPSADDVPI